jgi:hypothetical protein
MSYRITQFGTVTLPELDPEDDVSTFEARNSIVPLPDGWFDARGSERSRRNPLPLRLTRALISDGTPIETPATVSRAEFNALRALLGTRAKLYRTWSDEAETVEWTYARLLQAVGRADRKDNRGMAELELAFQIVSPCWYGVTPYTLSVGGFEVTHDGPFTVSNTGNCNVTDAALIVYAGSGIVSPPITYFRLWNTTTGHDFSWSGILQGGGGLEIDFGAQTIGNVPYGGTSGMGVDAYSGFVRPTTQERWMEFAPGDNLMEAYFTGEDYLTHIDIGFYPPWE